MTPEEEKEVYRIRQAEAYAEALRRIREAEESGALELDLSGLELNRLPPELASLTSLQSLNLEGSWLSGDLSPLAGLTSLQSLNLERSRLSSDLSPLAGLTSLQSLNLGESFLSGDLSPLAGLTSLQSLNLFFCYKLSGDLSPLVGLTSLQSLNLSGNGFSGDLSPLARLTSLQSLDLYRCNRLSGDLSPLAGLKSLQTLNINECSHLSDDLSPLARLTSLQSLNLVNCDQFSGDLSPLAGLKSLQTLNIYRCRLSGDLSPLAGLISLQSLDLSSCYKLSGDLSPLARLTSLQSLDLFGCGQLTDLSPLAGLTSLQSLDLSGCQQLTDLSPLAGLTSLRALNLDTCLGIQRFAPLESLLLTLEELYLFDCELDDLPPEVCSEHGQNILDKIRAHYEDLKSGQRRDAEVKVLFLGNGGVGKTQLCRRLRDLEFDPSVPTTHGIQLGEMALELDGFQESVRLNLWDFGGQDIYHGSHALFLHGQAIFLILWTPELEHQTTYHEGELSFRHRPISYWIDYLRVFAGTDASVLIIQSQCDTRDKRILHPPALVDDFPFHRFTEVSARTGLNLGILKESIKEAVRDRFDRRPPPPIGAGRLKVRERLRQMLEEDQKREPSKRQHRLLEGAEFDRLCDEVGGISDKEALLDFLHHNGVIFYRSGLFGNRIILDQNWALEAIYSIFHRDKCFKQLKKLHGRFSREDLELLIWSDNTPEEQKAFLGMMENCGICFKVRRLPNGEWEYIAPELLPPWSDAQEQLLGRLRDDRPDAEATAGYAFLHEGVLRGYLSKLGNRAKDAAIYWKYGCWFYEQKTRSQVLIESQWENAASEAGRGDIRLRAWGERADDLIEQLLRTLQTLRVGQLPEIKRTRNATVVIDAGAGVSSHATVETDASTMEIPSKPELPLKGTPEIFVSFAWGDDSSEDARQRTEVVDRLCETLKQHGWHILRDSEVLRSGDLISGFMKRIGLADHIIVVLSDKYLRSPYCMTELYSIYQRSVGEKEDFLRRIIPLALEDARFGTPEERVEYAKHWEARYLKLKSDLDHLSVEDFRLYKSMQKWHLDIGEILAHVSDVLSPHGFDEIVNDDFAALRQMLKGRR